MLEGVAEQPNEAFGGCTFNCVDGETCGCGMAATAKMTRQFG